MKTRRVRSVVAPSPIDLLEEGVHLLRRAPAEAWLVYAAGTAPFVLGLIYFVADMSRNPLAASRCAPLSLGMAMLYILMRGSHAAFARALAAVVRGEDAPARRAGGFARDAAYQAILAPLTLLLLAVSAAVVVPVGWAYALHQHLVAGHAPEGVRATLRGAARRARSWPGLNHGALALLLLLRFIIFLDTVLLLGFLPQLAKVLLGISSPFTESMFWILSTTFLGTAAALTWMVTDPLVKAVFVLRNHYLAARTSGEDLLAGLRTPAPAARAAAAALALFAAALFAPAAERGPRDYAAPPAAGLPLSGGGADPAAVGESCRRVLERTEFQWRMPRDLRPNAADEGPVARFFRDTFREINRMLQAVRDTINDLIRELIRRLFGDGVRTRTERAGFEWIPFLKGVTGVMVALILVAMVAILVRAWRDRRRAAAAAPAAAPAGVPDLEDDRVIATDLPEDEWLRLADELRRSGEHRKALRAVFLAGLSLLGRLRLLEIARGKSNREYAEELARRARRCPEVGEPFRAQVLRYERTWFGLHPAEPPDVDSAVQEVGRMRDLARE
jgi:hypothetical protein